MNIHSRTFLTLFRDRLLKAFSVLSVVVLFFSIAIPQGWFIVPDFFREKFPSVGTAFSTNTIDRVRDARVFVRSLGADTLTITGDATGIGGYNSRYIVKKPDGTLLGSETKLSTEGASTTAYSLTQSGDYQVVIPLPSRVWTFETTSQMVLETNKRKRTFRDINDGHAATKLFFYVPADTSTFTFYAMANRGIASANNQAILYNPDGSTNTTLGLGIDANSVTWSVATISSPTSGYWAASINVDSSTNDSEGTYWVEGVSNYFSTTTGNWFTPNFVNSTVEVAIDPATVMGDMGKVGGARLRESTAVAAPVEAAFLDIGLQTNEVVFNQTNREPSNDNADAFNLNLSGYNFSNVATTYTVTTLGAEPIFSLNAPASWLVGSLSYPSCGSNTDCKLQDVSTHDEWAEFALAMITNYNVNNSYATRFLRLTDEPDGDPVPATSHALIFNKAAARLATASSSLVSSAKIYSGAISEFDEASDLYFRDMLAVIDPDYHQYVGIHPWLLGYGGLGNIYTTPFFKEKTDEYLDLMVAEGGPTPKKAIVSEVNAKFGDSLSQDIIYYSSFDHAIWWWSMLVNGFVDARTEVMQYYPFEDTGAIFASRGMVKTDGTYKPVAYATKYFLDKVQSKVISTEVEGNNLEVEAMTTANSTQSAMNVTLVNKENRVQNVDLNFSITSAKNVSWSIERLTSGAYTTGTAVTSGTSTALPGTWTLPATMSATSLYNVSLSLSTPTNTAPTVNAGGDANTTVGNALSIGGAVTDDGFPNPPGALTYLWEKASGPGTVTFGSASAVSTTATFSTEGYYVIRLTASDNEISTSDEKAITVTKQVAVAGTYSQCNEYCANTAECASGFTCHQNKCRAPDNKEDTSCRSAVVNAGLNRTCNDYCADNSECNSAYVCYYNRCRAGLNVTNTQCVSPKLPTFSSFTSNGGSSGGSSSSSSQGGGGSSSSGDNIGGDTKDATTSATQSATKVPKKVNTNTRKNIFARILEFILWIIQSIIKFFQILLFSR